LPTRTRAHRKGETDASRERFDAHRHRRVQSTAWMNAYAERWRKQSDGNASITLSCWVRSTCDISYRRSSRTTTSDGPTQHGGTCRCRWTSRLIR
jgi:hypothetical protein